MLWNKIQKQLDKKGWTRYRLAKEAKISEMTLVKLRNGKAQNIHFSTMCKIADALDVSLDEFR